MLGSDLFVFGSVLSRRVWTPAFLPSDVRTLLRLLVYTAGTHSQSWKPTSTSDLVGQDLLLPESVFDLLVLIGVSLYSCSLGFPRVFSLLDTTFPILHFQAGAPLGLHVSLWPGRCGVPTVHRVQTLSRTTTEERGCPG